MTLKLIERNLKCILHFSYPCTFWNKKGWEGTVGSHVLFLIFCFWSFRHCLSDWAFGVSKWVIVSIYIVVLVFYSSCYTGASSATMSCICLLGEWVVLTNTKTIKLYNTEINSNIKKNTVAKVQQNVMLHSAKITFFLLLTLLSSPWCHLYIPPQVKTTAFPKPGWTF